MEEIPAVLVPVWVMVMADRWAPSFRSHNFKLFEECQVKCSYFRAMGSKLRQAMEMMKEERRGCRQSRFCG
jgi:hypothetical protein